MRQNVFRRLNEIHGSNHRSSIIVLTTLICVRVAVRSCNPCPVVNMAQFSERGVSKCYISAFETHVNGSV